MAIKPVITIPNDLLAEVSQPVKLDDPSLPSLIQDLHDSLEAQHDPPGVGLSAPQIGILQRVFLARSEPGQQPEVFINPEFVDRSKKLTTKKDNSSNLEGCLSIPARFGEVQRHQWIEVKYHTYDAAGNLIQKIDHADNFYGRVIQHEYDHLDGILFTQRTLQQGGRLYELEIEDDREVLVPLEL